MKCKFKIETKAIAVNQQMKIARVIACMNFQKRYFHVYYWPEKSVCKYSLDFAHLCQFVRLFANLLRQFIKFNLLDFARLCLYFYSLASGHVNICK